MADALVSVILEQLASVFLEQAKNEVALVVGVEEEVRKLTSNFQAIQAVLEDAERRQVKELAVKQWLAKLKDVSYDIDDVLDEWKTAILKMQIGGDENASERKRKVSSFIPFSWFGFKQVALRRDIAVKIKELNETLDVIRHEKIDFNIISTKGTEEFERKITASLISVSGVHVRDDDKKKIVAMLASESSKKPTPDIISIVGMGGMGKTTLAQLVYNDDTVKALFKQRIWVCVSDPFDEKRIAKAILEGLEKREAAQSNELNTLLQCICNSIEGQKFLLVLDDVWTEDPSSFEQLKNSLECGLPGSKILVTTRKEGVAKIMGTTDVFSLERLSDEECWLLFSQVAFFGRSRELRENLEGIGWGIVKKCDGLPLAAKVLGGFLRLKDTREEWRSVLDSEVWELEEAGKHLFPPLLLSYYELSSTMRQCFLYCAVFPKDYMIEKDELIKLWMAQGYLKARSSKDTEVVGEECFMSLAMCSFFQDFEKDEDGRIIRCKMHDIVHDFAQYLTENECFVMEGNSPEESTLHSPHVKARHSMMRLARTVSIPTSIYNAKSLRSLIVKSLNEELISPALPKVFDELTCLRALNLSHSSHFCSSRRELPSEVGKLIHLRHLNLAYNDRLVKLPETVCDLCNLQSLDLSYCGDLEKLPDRLANLFNLRHLRLFETDRLGFMSRGIDRLSSLRTLDSFVVSSDGNVNEASTLEDLKNLIHLRGRLRIQRLGRVGGVSEAKKVLLDNMEHLLGLDLDFRVEEGEGGMTNDEQVIEALEPPRNLEQLSILNFRGTRVFPSWMISLTNLKEVQIGGCLSCEILPPLGKLSSLESLRIGTFRDAKGYSYACRAMCNVRKVGEEFLGIENDGPSNREAAVIAFPKLKGLWFYGMVGWEEWDCGIPRRPGKEEDTSTSMRIMPCLRYLEILQCPKLKGLPDYIIQTASLEKLIIGGCRSLENRYEARTEDDWHKISHIPNIRINGYERRNGGLIKDFADATQR